MIVGTEIKRGRYSKLRNRSYRGRDDTSEQEMWLWYWDVLFHREKMDQDMKVLWKYYDYRFKNEKFVSLRQKLTSVK